MYDHLEAPAPIALPRACLLVHPGTTRSARFKGLRSKLSHHAAQKLPLGPCEIMKLIETYTGIGRWPWRRTLSGVAPMQPRGLPLEPKDVMPWELSMEPCEIMKWIEIYTGIGQCPWRRLSRRQGRCRTTRGS